MRINHHQRLWMMQRTRWVHSVIRLRMLWQVVLKSFVWLNFSFVLFIYCAICEWLMIV